MRERMKSTQTHSPLYMDPAKFTELRKRAEQLRKEYEDSSAAFQRAKQNREAFVELGAEVLSRSEWRLPKKVTRGFGSSASTRWRSSEQFKRFVTATDELVREAEEELKSLRGQKPSLRKVHEAVMPDTKLRHLKGVLATAEHRARSPVKRKKHRPLKRTSSRGIDTRDEKRVKMRLASHVQTLVGVAVTAIFGLIGLALLVGLDLPWFILFVAGGTGVVVLVTDFLLSKASPYRHKKEGS